MQLIKLLKKRLIQSQIYVSFCATFLGIFVLYEQKPYQTLLFFVVFLTFWNGYIFTVYHKNAIFINLVGFFLITLIIFKFFDFYFYVKWLIVLLLGLIYNADFFKINLREFSLIKTFYVGFVWAMTLVWLPLQNFQIHWFSIIFFFVSGITFPFEIRDLKRDDFTTLPMKIGIQNTKYLSYIFLFISNLISIFHLEIDFNISLFITTISAYTFIYFTDEKRQDWYFSVLMESLSMMPIIIYFILNLLKI